MEGWNMRENRMIVRQVVDWSAAIMAGLIAGTVFLLLNIVVFESDYGGTAAIPIRYMASIVMGSDVLPPPATFDADVVVVGLIVHYVLSVIFALILAVIVHRWGFLMGVVVGALFGLAVFAINIYTVTLLFPWFYVWNTPLFAIAHVVYGALVGGIYEGFEVEEYVAVE
jgi:hypothetical protein